MHLTGGYFFFPLPFDVSLAVYIFYHALTWMTLMQQALTDDFYLFYRSYQDYPKKENNDNLKACLIYSYFKNYLIEYIYFT